MKFIRDITQPRWMRFAVFFAIWGLGTLGYEASRSIGNVPDSAYLALQMFALNFEAPLEGAFDPDNLLLWTRYLAAGFSVFALLTLFSQWFAVRVRSLRQLARNNLVILLGFGEVNRMLLDALLEEGRDVLVVDTGFDPVDRLRAREDGFVIREFDLTDTGRLAGLPLGMAKRVYVSCGADATNLKVGRQAALLVQEAHKAKYGSGTTDAHAPLSNGCDENGAPIVSVHISSPKFMLDLACSEDYALNLGRDMSFFSIKTATARVLVQRARFVERAADLGQARPHVVVVGAGELAEAIICDVIHAAITGNHVPRITVLAPDGAAAQARFSARYPQLCDGSLPQGDQPDITFLSADPAALNFDNDTQLGDLEADSEPPTAWVFACREDEENLDASLRLEAAMYKRRRRHVPVFKRIWQGDAVPLTPTENFGVSEIFGQRSDPRLRRQIFDLNSDWLAGRIHTKYGFDRKATELARENADSGGTDSRPFVRLWKNLPQNVRRSNRMAGLHLTQKLRDQGYRWRGVDEGLLPYLPKGSDLEQALDRTRAQKGEEDLPDALSDIARTEHLRWMIDRALCGWKYADKRSNRQHLHPNMVAFDKLKNSTRRIDLTSLAVAFDLTPQTALVRLREGFRQVEHGFDITALAGVTAPQGTTDVTIRYQTLSMDPDQGDLDDLSAFLRAFGAQPSACRVHFQILGPVEFSFLETVSTPEGEPPETRERSLHDWMAEATAGLDPDILVDVTFLPEQAVS